MDRRRSQEIRREAARTAPCRRGALVRSRNRWAHAPGEWVATSGGPPRAHGRRGARRTRGRYRERPLDLDSRASRRSCCRSRSRTARWACVPPRTGSRSRWNRPKSRSSRAVVLARRSRERLRLSGRPSTRTRCGGGRPEESALLASVSHDRRTTLTTIKHWPRPQNGRARRPRRSRKRPTG